MAANTSVPSCARFTPTSRGWVVAANGGYVRPWPAAAPAEPPNSTGIASISPHPSGDPAAIWYTSRSASAISAIRRVTRCAGARASTSSRTKGANLRRHRRRACETTERNTL